MRKKFALNLILLVFLNLLVKPFWIFGIDRTVQNMTGVTEYGLYFSLFNFSLLLNILLDMGLANFNNRKVAQNPEFLPALLSNMVVLRLLLALIYTIVTITLAYFFGYGGRQIHLLLFLITNQFLATFTLYLRTNISGLQLFTMDSFLSVSDRLIMVLLCAATLWFPYLKTPLTIELFVYLQTVAYTLSTLLVLIIVLVKSPRLTFVFDPKILSSLLKGSIPFALLIFLMSVYTRTDGVLLERLLPDGKAQAGVYAQAYRLLDAANMFAYLFPTLLLPMFAKQIAQKEDSSSLVRLSMGVLFVFSVAFAFSSLLFSHPIMQLLYTKTESQSSAVFSWLVLSFIPMSVTTIFGTLLTAKGSLKALNLVSCFAVALNLSANFVLIPILGAKGAAITSFITQFVVACLTLGIYLNEIKPRVNWNLLGRYGLFLGLSGLSSWFFSKVQGWFPILFAVNGLLILGLGFAAGLLPISKVIDLVRNR